MFPPAPVRVCPPLYSTQAPQVLGLGEHWGTQLEMQQGTTTIHQLKPTKYKTNFLTAAGWFMWLFYDCCV